jgi:hypothetical protein
MPTDERRRLAIQFGIGDGDSEWPDSAQRLVFEEKSPLAEWEGCCPKWRAALNGLHFGQAEPLAEALNSSEPILHVYKTILVFTLRSDARLPFRLVVIGRPLQGQKRAGRPKQDLRLTAEKLAELIEQGALESTHIRQVFAAALRSDGRLPFRITVKSNTGGRFPAKNGIRDLLLAVRMAEALEEMQKRGERDPYRAASRSVADERGVYVGPASVEAAYERHRSNAQKMRDWAADLRTELKERGVPLRDEK